MEGVIALFIPIIAVGGFFLWAISTSPVGKAYAQRIKGHTVEGNTDELRQELSALRQEVAELAERVDFTERLLAKQQDAARIEKAR
jgi:hypothetical protein